MEKYSFMEKKHNRYKILTKSDSIYYNKALKRRVNFIAYLLQHKEFVTKIVEGKVLGKRGRGRLNKPYLEYVKYHIQFG